MARQLIYATGLGSVEHGDSKRDKKTENSILSDEIMDFSRPACCADNGSCWHSRKYSPLHIVFSVYGWGIATGLRLFLFMAAKKTTGFPDAAENYQGASFPLGSRVG